jgi:hypothetical protein
MAGILLVKRQFDMSPEYRNRRLRGWRAILAFTALAATLSISDRGKTETVIPDASQKTALNRFATPSALLAELRTSLVNRDEKLFRRCFNRTARFDQCLHETFRNAEATFGLRDLIEKQYGKKGWNLFQEAGLEASPNPRLTPKLVPTGAGWWDKLEINQHGDTATFYNPVVESTNVMSNEDRDQHRF